jgi:hypothetical protein
VSVLLDIRHPNIKITRPPVDKLRTLFISLQAEHKNTFWLLHKDLTNVLLFKWKHNLTVHLLKDYKFLSQYLATEPWIF